MDDENLWGNLDLGEPITTPAEILKHQAAFIGAMTNNVVQAIVEPIASVPNFRYDFNLLVAALDNYRYGLFVVYHGITMYPLSIITQYEQSAREIQCQNEDYFRNSLREILSSAPVHGLVQSLYAQARAIS